MQSKGVIKLLAILLAIACIYQLSFSLKARSVEKKAAEYAAKVSESDSLRQAAEIYYLDSVQNRPVYDLGFISFTYKEVKEKEINLGLDLKGGMNVMLEVQVEDVLKALAGDSAHDPMFEEAIARANKALKEGTNNYIGEFAKAYREVSGGAPLAALFVSPDRKDITPNSSDSEVEKILQEETDAAIDASFNILRSRIDHFGVTQPNIMRLPNSHRILVELPGVKEPQRVRDLLQGTASLEFWLTYDAREVLPALAAADKLVKAELAELPAATQPETASAEAEAVGEQTASGDAAGLIAEIGADSVAAAGQVDAGRYDRTQNPLLAVLDPNYAGGAAIGAAYKADMAAVNVQNKVSRATGQLPSEVTQIGVTTMKRQTSMVKIFSLYSPDDTYDETFLSNYSKINIEPSLMMISVQDVEFKGNSLARYLQIFADTGVVVDMISQSAPHGTTIDFSFTASSSDLPLVMKAISAANLDKDAKASPLISVGYSKLNLFGEEMVTSCGVAARALNALAMADIEVLLITTSDLDISLLVRAENEDAAYDVLKKAFEL